MKSSNPSSCVTLSPFFGVLAVTLKPTFSSLQGGAAQIGDRFGDQNTQIVQLERPTFGIRPEVIQ
jgi:hypothetical protein